MKRNLALLAISLSMLCVPLFAQDADVDQADRILRKVADKLASVKLLGYRYGFDYGVPSQGRSMKFTADAFLDLKPADGTSRFRFQFSGDNTASNFNGTERFILDKKNKKIYVESTPSFDSFGDTFLMHSPISLKYSLPRVIADKTIQKKVSEIRSEGSDRYLIEFSLKKRTITSEGEIVDIRPNHLNTYRITVDRSTLLPVEVVQTNDDNDEIVKTTYASMTDKPAIPPDASWFFSTYLNEYKLQKKDKLTLIEPGKIAPDFTLAQYGSAAEVRLDRYKGKVVLLEFWITQCNFCITAVPKLNTLGKRFEGLEIVSINMYDSPAAIDSFKKRNKPEYTILTDGDSIATAYGAEAFPAIVLIDRSGKVVYSSSGLFENELEAAIAKVLETQ